MTSQADLKEKLSRVSASGTGIAHANDEQRFKEFIKAAHQDSAEYSEEDLRAVVADLGWTTPADTVWSRYSSGRARLSAKNS